MKRLQLIITLLFGLNLQSQISTLEIDNKSELQTGIDIKSKNYFVFDGFDTFYKKSFYSKQWQALKYKYNQLPTTKNFSQYNFFHIEGKNFLVDKGCGEVYEFKNDSLIRIDNSFQHKNQFSSCTFVYNKEIYYFGGYGLFTFKNILTKFDFKTKEWELIKYSDYSKIPEPRQNALSFLNGNFLYIISGISEDYHTKQTTGASTKLNDVWKLDLLTKTWEFVGILNVEKELLYNVNGNNTYQNNTKFHYDNSRLFEFDFKNNTLNFSEPKDKYSLSFNEKYNTENNEIIYAIKSTDVNLITTKVIVEPFKSYSGENYQTELLIKEDSIKYMAIVIVVLIILFSFIYFRKRSKTKTDKNCIIFKNNLFLHKNKPINNLSTNEINLLSFFYSNYSNPIQMNEVVDFISKNDDISYNTLTKKKDTILNSLKQKLAFVLDINEEDLFIYQKNKEDKRIKEIQLNPHYFKI